MSLFRTPMARVGADLSGRNPYSAHNQLPARSQADIYAELVERGKLPEAGDLGQTMIAGAEQDQVEQAAFATGQAELAGVEAQVA